MHLKRWITSIVVLPLLILLILKATPAFFAGFICVVSLIACWEFFNIVFFGAQVDWQKNPIPILAFITGPLLIWAIFLNDVEYVLFILVFNLIFTVMLSFSQFKSRSSVVDIIFKQALCIIYVSLFLSFLIKIRCEPSGILWIFFLLSVVFSGDIGAFYTGKTLGKHKLCPSISPGKTWEGAFGGLVANVGIGSVFKYYLLTDLAWAPCIPMFLCIGIIGIVGDLFESEMKRISGIKDSGTILPGHGGILDRIDALLFAAPVMYYYKVLVLNVG